MPRMSQLTAINHMLRAAGEQPVSSLLTDGSNDVSVAIAVLERVTTQVQGERRNKNRAATELAPDVNGNIFLADNVIWFDTRDTDTDKQVIRRGDKIFNLTDNTDVFTENLKLWLAYEEDFVDLPLAIQEHITARAAREYQQDVKGDREVDALLREREAKAMAFAQSYDATQTSCNWLDTTDAQNILNRRG